MPTPSAPVDDPRPLGRPKMPMERIVSTALEIVDADGADALTLRALAKQLGSSTATLYRHVENRDALLDLVVERVFDDVEIDETALGGADWIGVLAHAGTALFDAVARHPNTAPLLSGRVPTGPNAMRLRESCLALLMANGFPAPEARTLTAAFGRLVIGFAVQLGDDSGPDDASERLRSADPSLYPATRRSAGDTTVPLHEEFNIALDLLLRGLREVAGRAR